MFKYNVFQNMYNSLYERAEFNLRTGHVRLVLDRVTIRQVFLEVLRPSPDNCHFAVANY
jgi:hypothetical protein